jgi:putative endopeptidase
VLGGTDGTIAETSATDVYEFEKRIAEFSLPMQERRDPVKTYNKVTTTQLKETAPAIPWDSFFEHVGLIGDFGDLVLENVAYFSKLSELLLKTNLEIIKVYLKYHFLHSCSPFLNEAFVNEHFEFTEKALKGTASIQLRWKRILSQVSENLEDDVSKLYVAKHFPPESKKAASEMVQYIIKAFEHRLKTVDWMQDETRKKGLEKLAKFGVKIGYPDKWKDYSSLQGKLSRSTSYIENMLIVREFNYNMEMKHTNNAVDRLKWELPPFTVNAYFHPMLNEIVFPAAILQKPFFYAPTKENPFGDVALNFGGIGGTV